MFAHVSKGTKMRGVVGYLLGPGRANEHTGMRVIGGSEFIRFRHAGAVASPDLIRDLTRDLDASHKALAERTSQRPHVFHVSLSIAAREGELTDEQWQNIAQRYTDLMGFTGDPTKPDCEWSLIRHGKSAAGNDHVHIALNLVRPDGTRASTHNDMPRSRDAARVLEREFGLEQLHAGKGHAHETRAEQEKAKKHGKSETDRAALRRMVRSAATTADSEAEFVRTLRGWGVIVSPRFAKGQQRAEGFSVGLRPRAGEPLVMFGAAKNLAADLGLGQLRQRWNDSPDEQREAFTEWKQAAAQARAVREGRPEPEAQHEQKQRQSPGMDDPNTRERFEQIVNEIRGLRSESDEQRWQSAASDFAGMFGTWAQHESDPETLHGLRDLSETFGDCAARRTPARRGLSKGSVGFLMMLSAAQRDPSGRAARIAIMRQILNTTAALHDMQRAGNDLRRARALNRAANESLVPIIRKDQSLITAAQTGAGHARGPGVDAETAAAQRAAEATAGSFRSTGAPAAPRPTTRRPEQGTERGKER